jgi:adenylate cyclase
MFPTLIAAIGVIGMCVLYLASAHYQFKTSGIWFPVVLPLFIQAPLAFFGTVLWKYVETHKERQNVRKALGYYVPGGVADQMAKKMGDIRESKKLFRGTLLCTDAENYTTLSETLDPETLARVMNDYFETVFEPVKQNNGVVSEVVADSMIAVWEAGESETDHRIRGCHAALGIARAVQEFNSKNREFLLPTRIGLHTGRMMVGNIGAIDRYEYNPIGDIVNTASRIEGLNKHLGTRILASREVVDGLDEFLTRDLGEFVLAGKSKPVAVCELICSREEAEEQQERLCSIFQEVLEAYRNQSWENGIRMLSDLLKMNGGDGPSRFYLELCKECSEKPSMDVWDGMVRVGKK